MLDVPRSRPCHRCLWPLLGSDWSSADWESFVIRMAASQSLVLAGSRGAGQTWDLWRRAENKKNISERKIFHKTLTSIESSTNTLSRMLGKLFSQTGLHIFNRVTERQTTRLIIFILNLERQINCLQFSTDQPSTNQPPCLYLRLHCWLVKWKIK